MHRSVVPIANVTLLRKYLRFVFAANAETICVLNPPNEIVAKFPISAAPKQMLIYCSCLFIYAGNSIVCWNIFDPTQLANVDKQKNERQALFYTEEEIHDFCGFKTDLMIALKDRIIAVDILVRKAFFC